MKHRLNTLLALLMLVPGAAALRAVGTRRGAELNPVLAQTARLLLIYSLLFSVGWIL